MYIKLVNGVENMFTVFQFKMSKEAVNAVNDMGWAAKDSNEEVLVHLETKMKGSDGFSAWMSPYFKPAVAIDAADLDDVFHKGNMMSRFPEAVTKLSDKVHSVSVGDVIRNDADGTYHMVDDFGFTQLLSFIEKAVA